MSTPCSMFHLLNRSIPRHTCRLPGVAQACSALHSPAPPAPHRQQRRRAGTRRKEGSHHREGSRQTAGHQSRQAGRRRGRRQSRRAGRQSRGLQHGSLARSAKGRRERFLWEGTEGGRHHGWHKQTRGWTDGTHPNVPAAAAARHTQPPLHLRRAARPNGTTASPGPNGSPPAMMSSIMRLACGRW